MEAPGTPHMHTYATLMLVLMYMYIQSEVSICLATYDERMSLCCTGKPEGKGLVVGDVRGA